MHTHGRRGSEKELLLLISPTSGGHFLRSAGGGAGEILKLRRRRLPLGLRHMQGAIRVFAEAARENDCGISETDFKRQFSLFVAAIFIKRFVLWVLRKKLSVRHNTRASNTVLLRCVLCLVFLCIELLSKADTQDSSFAFSLGQIEDP